jgi:hypothetical protein
MNYLVLNVQDLKKEININKFNAPSHVFGDSSGDLKIAERHDDERHQEVHHSID